jgi:glycosyltransferase involved in cell wall biosynthesis
MRLAPVEPKRVLFISGQLAMGGAERQLTVLAPALVSAGLTVDVASFVDGPTHQALTDGGVRVHLATGSQVRRIRELVSLTNSTKPDVIVAWHFYLGLYGAIVSAVSRRPWVAMLQSSVAHEYDLAKNAARIAMKTAPVIMANSHGAVAELKLLGKRVGYLPNGVDTGRFECIGDREVKLRERILSQANGRPVVCAVGVLRPEKRFDQFLETLAACRTQGHAVFGVLMGDGSERAHLERRATELGLSENDVLFAGMVGDVPAALNVANLVVLTSSTEGTPNVLLEGLGAGKPFVSTDVGDARVVAERSGVGVISPMIAEVFAGHIISVLTNDSLIASASLDGPEFLRREYSVETLSTHFVHALRGEPL